MAGALKNVAVLLAGDRLRADRVSEPVSNGYRAEAVRGVRNLLLDQHAPADLQGSETVGRR